MPAYTICCLPGDGIGPEIMAAAKRVLDATAQAYDFTVTCNEYLMGGAAIDATRLLHEADASIPVTALPQETLEAAQAADAVLLAAVGGPRWDTTDPGEPRPEQGLLGIRKALDLYINLRPVHVYNALVDASSLKPHLVRGVDMLIVRELTGGLYFGARERIDDAPGMGVDGGSGVWVSDACEYGEYEIERVVRFAFEAARGRTSGHLTSVDKANVLGTSRLWRDVVARVAVEYTDVPYENMLVDNAAMQLVARPLQFDVMVTENTFGDILSDEAAQLTGSLGMLASASLGTGTPLFEPSHGSAPDIAGTGKANPLAQILSAALMCRFALHEEAAAAAIEAAVEATLEDGWRTEDIADASTPDTKVLSCDAMADAVVAHVAG